MKSTSLTIRTGWATFSIRDRTIHTVSRGTLYFVTNWVSFVTPFPGAETEVAFGGWYLCTSWVSYPIIIATPFHTFWAASTYNCLI